LQSSRGFTRDAEDEDEVFLLLQIFQSEWLVNPPSPCPPWSAGPMFLRPSSVVRVGLLRETLGSSGYEALTSLTVSRRAVLLVLILPLYPDEVPGQLLLSTRLHCFLLSSKYCSRRGCSELFRRNPLLRMSFVSGSPVLRLSFVHYFRLSPFVSSVASQLSLMWTVRNTWLSKIERLSLKQRRTRWKDLRAVFRARRSRNLNAFITFLRMSKKQKADAIKGMMEYQKRLVQEQLEIEKENKTLTSELLSLGDQAHLRRAEIKKVRRVSSNNFHTNATAFLLTSPVHFAGTRQCQRIVEEIPGQDYEDSGSHDSLPFPCTCRR